MQKTCKSCVKMLNDTRIPFCRCQISSHMPQQVGLARARETWILWRQDFCHCFPMLPYVSMPKSVQLLCWLTDAVTCALQGVEHGANKPSKPASTNTGWNWQSGVAIWWCHKVGDPHLMKPLQLWYQLCGDACGTSLESSLCKIWLRCKSSFVAVPLGAWVPFVAFQPWDACCHNCGSQRLRNLKKVKAEWQRLKMICH